MTITPAALELLKRYEGFEGRAYLCPAGVWTIGYGFTKGVKPGDTITRAEADARLLNEELPPFERPIREVAGPWASENQIGAMTSLAYNIGLAAFMRSTVLRKHQQGDKAGAASAFLLWTKAGRPLKVLPGLVARRNDEARLYLTPDNA